MGVRVAVIGVLALACACGGGSSAPGGTARPSNTPPDDQVPPGQTGVTSSRVRYTNDRAHSPISSSIADNLRKIASGGSNRHDDMFMKVGDSISDSFAVMSCFVEGNVNLDGRDLQSTIDYFAAANVSGPSKCNEDWCRSAHTGYNRASYVAQGGATSTFPFEGIPAPLDSEDNAIAPRFALVQYGTNDSTLILTSADLGGFSQFYQHMQSIVDALEMRGVVPILYTIPPYTETRNGHANVPTMNAIIRAVAQSRAIPLIDFNLELQGLPDYGLWDGVHPRVEFGGCVFTPDGLQYGYNVRNLLSIQALSRLYIVLNGGAAPDDPTTVSGGGTTANPFIIDGLPFVDASTGSNVVYRLALSSESRVRFLALTRSGSASVTVKRGGVAVASGTGVVQASLAAATYEVTVNGDVFSLAIVTCESSDATCN